MAFTGPMGIVITVINISYLAAIITAAVLMARRFPARSAEQRRADRWLLAAVAALLAGDVVHIVTQAYVTFTGREPLALIWGGRPVPWTGVGSFATSFMLTFFYLFALLYRQAKFDRPWTGLEVVVVLLMAIRLALLFPPQNNWGGPAPGWRVYRNIPFALAGLTVAGMFVQAGRRTAPPSGKYLSVAGWGIVASFACYMGTVLLVDAFPIAGTLMLPKMIAYVVVVISFLKLLSVDSE